MKLAPEQIRVPPNGGIPNNPRLPALVTRAVLKPDEAEARAAFARNGWGGLWTWTVFGYHHYHPASHEALACIAGWAELHLGGPDGPTLRLEPGDVAVLPAGFGHKRLASGDGFRVVGAYPPGQESPAIVKAHEIDISEALQRVGTTPLPETDPVNGPAGALRRLWS